MVLATASLRSLPIAGWLALPLLVVGLARGGSDTQPDRLLRELLDAHNAERAKEKLSPLSASPKLSEAAEKHARDMAEHEKMAHEGTDGSTPSVRVERVGYYGRAIGENVASGQESVSEVMKSWMNSPEHKKNILGDFNEMGGGIATDANGRPYWCVDFGRSWPVVKPEKASAAMVAAVRQARDKEKRTPLRVDERLARAAQKEAERLAQADSLDGSEKTKPNPFESLKASGYPFRRVSAEIASGESDAEALVGSWLKDPEHRKNLLGDFRDVGIGYAATAKGKPYWCLFFAEPLR